MYRQDDGNTVNISRNHSDREARQMTRPVGGSQMGTQHSAGCALCCDNRRCCADCVAFADMLLSGCISIRGAGVVTFGFLNGTHKVLCPRKVSGGGQATENTCGERTIPTTFRTRPLEGIALSQSPKGVPCDCGERKRRRISGKFEPY